MAASRLGCKIVWQRKPLKRIFRELECNAIDATLPCSYSKDRTAFSVHPIEGGQPGASMALWTFSYNFYVKQGPALKGMAKSSTANHSRWVRTRVIQ
jgi:hypothetical protein